MGDLNLFSLVLYARTRHFKVNLLKTYLWWWKTWLFILDLFSPMFRQFWSFLHRKTDYSRYSLSAS